MALNLISLAWCSPLLCAQQAPRRINPLFRGAIITDDEIDEINRRFGGGVPKADGPKRLIAVSFVTVNGITVQREEEFTVDAPPKAGGFVLQRNVLSRRYRVAEGSFDNYVLGERRSTTGVRDLLDALMEHKIARIDRICSLSDAQKQKLRTAGRGDIQRVFDRVEEVRTMFLAAQLPSADNGEDFDMPALSKWSRKFSKEAAEVRALIESAPFDDGSLFVKTLRRVLTPEQAARYEPPAKPDRPQGPADK